MKLTPGQRRALRRLAELHEKFPRSPHRFNPPRSVSRSPATFWRRMEPMGLVSIDRVSDRHFRYRITEAGRAALAEESANG